MKPPKTLFKLGAVLSSTLLMGAFVAYQAGAFNGLRATSTPPAPAGTTPTSQEDIQSPQAHPTNLNSVDASIDQKPAFTPERLQTILMSTSKSLSPVDHFKGLTPVTVPPPAARQPQPSPPPEPTPTLLPRSKSMGNILDITRPAPAQPPAAPPTQQSQKPLR